MSKIFPYITLFFITPLAFGLNSSSGRFSGDIMDVMSMIFFRWLGVIVIMLPFMAVPLWRARHTIRNHLPLFTIASIMGMIICPFFVYIAGYYTTAINIVLIYTSSPVLTILIERIFYGKPIRFKSVIGTIMAIFGVIYIATQGNLNNLAAIEFSMGDFYAFISATSFSIYSILIRQQEQYITGTELFTINSLFGFVLAIPLLLYEVTILQKPIVLSQEFFLLWGMLSLVSSIFGYMGMVYIIKSFDVTKASYVIYITVLYGTGIGVLFLDEVLQQFHIVSAVIIISGVFIAMHNNKKPQL